MVTCDSYPCRHPVPSSTAHAAANPPGRAGTRRRQPGQRRQHQKRILGALTSAAIGVAELRNRYGNGHGRLAVPTGLGPRHARFAFAAWLCRGRPVGCWPGSWTARA
ncbi:MULTISPECIES: abortive infection family protein [Streptomyces]|uniref:abortive infection family protein n=1 Tax=Streptomyces TaxID=1883 RepID=UPI0021AFF79E|nr:abortive infection family protein [Streptomyces sp. WAC05950]